MAAPNENLVFRCGGALWLAPTNIAPPGYGTATALGICHDVRLSAVTRQFNIQAEEYGQEVTEAVHMGRDWVLTCLVRGWDNDTLGMMFPNTSTGGSSGNKVISEPGGLLSGSLLSGKAVKLLFAPFNTTHKGFIVYRALPNIHASRPLDFNTAKDLSFLATFRCLRDGSGRAVKIGQVADLAI